MDSGYTQRVIDALKMTQVPDQAQVDEGTRLLEKVLYKEGPFPAVLLTLAVNGDVSFQPFFWDILVYLERFRTFLSRLKCIEEDQAIRSMFIGCWRAWEENFTPLQQKLLIFLRKYSRNGSIFTLKSPSYPPQSLI